MICVQDAEDTAMQRIKENNRSEIEPLERELQALKERLYKSEKEIAALRQLEKFMMDQNANNSKILDLVQIDVAKIKKEGGEGMMASIQKEMEEFKKKIEESQMLQAKKQAYNDRKRIKTVNICTCRSDSDQGYSKVPKLGSCTDFGEIQGTRTEAVNNGDQAEGH